MTAAFPALIALSAVMINEERVDSPPARAEHQRLQRAAASAPGTASTAGDAGTPTQLHPAAATAAAGPAREQHQEAASAGPAAAAAAAGAADGGDGGDGLACRAQQLWGTLSTPSIAVPVAFLCLLSATPSAGEAMFFYHTQALGFSPTFLGQVQMAVAVASLAGE